jgi:hypothetical protein
LHQLLLIQKAGISFGTLSKWNAALIFFKYAVNLLPVISSKLLKISDREHLLSEYTGIASLPAAATLSSGASAIDALQLLEHGRAVISSQLLKLRSYLTELKERYPDLADKLVYVRAKLDIPCAYEMAFRTSNYLTSHWRAAEQERKAAWITHKTILESIREKSEFENFKTFPSREELLRAARLGSIVYINGCSSGCDAFLVKSDGIEVVPLPSLTTCRSFPSS